MEKNPFSHCKLSMFLLFPFSFVIFLTWKIFFVLSNNNDSVLFLLYLLFENISDACNKQTKKNLTRTRIQIFSKDFFSIHINNFQYEFSSQMNRKENRNISHRSNIEQMIFNTSCVCCICLCIFFGIKINPFRIFIFSFIMIMMIIFYL